MMKLNEEIVLNDLLKESLSEDFSLPQTIDIEVKRKMNAATEAKQRRFSMAIITCSVLFTGLWFLVLWNLLPSMSAKLWMILLSSVTSLLIVVFIIYYKIKEERSYYEFI